MLRAQLPQALPPTRAAPGRSAARLALGVAAIILLASPATGDAGDSPDPSRASVFGFAGVDCGIDDPHDDSGITDYSAEVAPFTNVAHLCAHDPSSDLARRIDRMARRGLKAILDVEGIFFERRGPEDGGGLGPNDRPALRLRPDGLERWRRLVDRERLEARQARIAGVFVADEPTWNGIPFEELDRVMEAVAESLPEVPPVLVEAWPVLEDLVIPQAARWIAFDRYGVLDPANDPRYRSELELLRSKRSHPEQQILLIFESRWLPRYGAQGFPPETLAAVAESYLQLLEELPDGVGMVGYLWPGGFDEPGQLGGRNLPECVQEVYRAIGERLVEPCEGCGPPTPEAPAARRLLAPVPPASSPAPVTGTALMRGSPGRDHSNPPGDE